MATEVNSDGYPVSTNYAAWIEGGDRTLQAIIKVKKLPSKQRNSTRSRKLKPKRSIRSKKAKGLLLMQRNADYENCMIQKFDIINKQNNERKRQLLHERRRKREDVNYVVRVDIDQRADNV